MDVFMAHEALFVVKRVVDKLVTKWGKSYNYMQVMEWELSFPSCVEQASACMCNSRVMWRSGFGMEMGQVRL